MAGSNLGVITDGVGDHMTSILFMLVILLLIYFANSGRLQNVVAVLRGPKVASGAGVIQAGPIVVPLPNGGNIPVNPYNSGPGGEIDKSGKLP